MQAAKGWNKTNIPELPHCMTAGFRFREELSTTTFPTKRGELPALANPAVPNTHHS